MTRRRSCPPVDVGGSAFVGYRFPPEVIVLAVRWYLRFGLSYRDLEELLAERGVEVDHVTLFRWVQHFTPLLVDAARPCRHAAGARWFVDETYVKVAGRWRYVYRAVDEHGQVIDVYVSRRRDLVAARRFFAGAITAHGGPDEVITDLAPALASVIEHLDVALHVLAELGPSRGRLGQPGTAVGRPFDESLAQAALATGDLTTAEDHASSAVDWARSQDVPVFLARALVFLAEARRRGGASSRAVAPLVDESLSLASRFDIRIAEQDVDRYGLRT